MASGLRPTLLPQCSSCARRLINHALNDIRPFQQQIRGKKKMVNRSETINVKLLENVPGYGEKGAIVPVRRGTMRNYWTSMGRAEYVPFDTLRELKRKNVPMQRNFTYMSEAELPVSSERYSSIPDVRPIQPVERAQVVQLTPERIHALLTIFLPPTLIFNRVPLTTTPSTPKDLPTVSHPPVSVSPSSTHTPSLSQPNSPSPSPSPATTTPPAPTPSTTPSSPPSPSPSQPPLSPIYGSVSPADITSAIHQALAFNEEASRVQVSDADIRFVVEESHPAARELREHGRIKHLGEYGVEIGVRGLEGDGQGEGVVRRRVRVVV